MTTNLSIDGGFPFTHSLTRSSLLEIFQPFLDRFICWWSYFSTIFSCEESSNFRRALVLVHPEDTIGFDFFRKHFFRCRDHFSMYFNLHFGIHYVRFRCITDTFTRYKIKLHDKVNILVPSYLRYV